MHTIYSMNKAYANKLLQFKKKNPLLGVYCKNNNVSMASVIKVNGFHPQNPKPHESKYVVVNSYGKPVLVPEKALEAFL